VSADVKTSPGFTPTESLIIDVLVARYRLGDTLWTFDSRNMPALRKLEDRGLVHTLSGVTENTVRAQLSDKAVRDHGTSWFQIGITMDHLPAAGGFGHQPSTWSKSHLEQLAELAELQGSTDPRAINTAHVLVILMITRHHTPHGISACADGGVVLKSSRTPGDPSVRTVRVSPDGESFQLHRNGSAKTTTYFADVLRFTSRRSE
jgi:hypothetical protein